MIYKIAFSPTQFEDKPEPGNPQLLRLSDTFVNVERPATLIADAIEAGHPFTFWMKGRRSEANFILGQHIALDFDKGNRNFNNMVGEPFAQKFASFLYPTLSNTEDHPKYRLLFLLDQPTMQVANMRRAIRALMWYYGDPDPKCKDAARFFYGAGVGFGHFYGKTLPLGKVKEMIFDHEQHEKEAAERAAAERPSRQRDEGVPADGHGLLRYWEERVRTAPEGDRNNELNAAAFSCGQAVLEGRLHADDVYSGLGYVARANGLTEFEITRTIKSGLDGAKKGGA